MTLSVEELFTRAIASFQAGRLEDAERCFTEVLQYDPKHVAALNLLGILLTHFKRYPEAEQILQSALNINSNSDATFYNYGIVLKALKRPSEASKRFSQALAINPGVAETWNNRGTVLNDLKHYVDAISDFNKAVALNPNYSEAFCNKGKSCGKLKRYDEALAAYDKAIALKPDLAEAWVGRGNVFFELRRHDEAFAAYDKALALRPDLAEGWLGRGHVHDQLRRYDEALAAYDKAIALKPDLAEAWVGRGNVHDQLRRYDEAFAAHDKALALKPDLAEAWLGRGNVLSDLKRHDEAFASYDKALFINVDLAQAWLGRGNVLLDFKRRDEALAAYDKALSIKPGLEGAWLGRGNALSDLKRYDEAFSAYDKALSINPDFAQAWVGRGNALADLTRYSEALTAYDTGITHEPDFADLYWNKGLLALTIGDFAAGWDLYEWRFRSSDHHPYYYSELLKNLNLNIRKDKREFIGKSVTVLAEQGIGDEIMFASILPDLIADARGICYECDKRLAHLFERSFPNVTFIRRDDDRKSVPTPSDITIKAGSLAYSYRKETSAFPKTTYLKADEGRVIHWREQLKRYANTRMRVGISWRGGTTKTRTNDRSIELDRLSCLTQVEGTLFVNLQYGNVRDEIDRFNQISKEKPVHELLENIDDFDDLAALIASLDLVISVQNTTVHLCGALGKPCWALIPFRPEWRYGSAREDMVWYSSIKLYRQTSIGDWYSVLQSVQNDLQRISRRRLDV